MPEQRDNKGSGNNKQSEEQILSGQQSQASEYGEQSDQTMTDRNEDASFGSEGDGMSGQPIGGNDSNIGSGTTLTQGADFGGLALSGEKQAVGTNDQALKVEQDSSSDMSCTPPKGLSDQGFIGSKAAEPADYRKESSSSPASTDSPSSAKATHGSDFANQGRGALDEKDRSEEDSGSP